MEIRSMKKGMFFTIAILSAGVLAFGCEWSGGAPDAGKRDVLEFKLPQKNVVPPAAVEKVVEARPETEQIEVGIDLSDSVPDIAFEHVDAQPTDHVLLARELIAAGDKATAMIELGKALYDDPEDYDAAFMLGRTARRSNKPELATQAFLLAAKIDPEVAAPWLQLTRLALDGKKNDLAEKRVLHALSVDPKLAEAHDLLGRVWLNRSHWHKAVNCFEKAVTLSPDNRYYWNNLGYAYLLKKDFSQAVIALEAAIEEEEDETSRDSRIHPQQPGVGLRGRRTPAGRHCGVQEGAGDQARVRQCQDQPGKEHEAGQGRSRDRRDHQRRRADYRRAGCAVNDRKRGIKSSLPRRGGRVLNQVRDSPKIAGPEPS